MSFKPPISTMKLGRETVDISTNYKDDFTFKGAAKPKSYAPVTTFIQPGVKMESSTEAHDQYTGTCDCDSGYVVHVVVGVVVFVCSILIDVATPLCF